jgi:hypothetical protein
MSRHSLRDREVDLPQRIAISFWQQAYLHNGSGIQESRKQKLESGSGVALDVAGWNHRLIILA